MVELSNFTSAKTRCRDTVIFLCESPFYLSTSHTNLTVFTMSDTSSAKTRFQTEIYPELDRKLKETSWKGGASEAHGVLSGLACRGIGNKQLDGKAWLFRMSEKAEVALLEGLYELTLRDLQSDGFNFILLIAGDESGYAQRIESLANWCGGFTQGFLYDGEEYLAKVADTVRESFHDIIAISRIDVATYEEQETDRHLVEIEEYLRVAIQVIFDELNPAKEATSRNADKLN